METLSYILFLLFVVMILSFLFKVLWFFLPFIIIAMGIVYIRMRYFETKKPNQPRNPSSSNNVKKDVIEAEFKVRDSDDN